MAPKEESFMTNREMTREMYDTLKHVAKEQVATNVELVKQANEIKYLTLENQKHAEYISKDKIRQAKQAGAAGTLSFIGAGLVSFLYKKFGG